MQDVVSLPLAAAKLGVSYAVVYRLAISGELGPVNQSRGRWQVTAAGIDAYAARSTDTQRADSGSGQQPTTNQ